MRKASAPRKLSPDVSRRLSDSRRQSAALTLREIHCPFCSFLVEKVFSDAAGHKMQIYPALKYWSFVTTVGAVRISSVQL